MPTNKAIETVESKKQQALAAGLTAVAEKLAALAEELGKLQSQGVETVDESMLSGLDIPQGRAANGRFLPKIGAKAKPLSKKAAKKAAEKDAAEKLDELRTKALAALKAIGKDKPSEREIGRMMRTIGEVPKSPKKVPINAHSVKDFITWFFTTPFNQLRAATHGQYKITEPTIKGGAYVLYFHSAITRDAGTTGSGRNIIGLRPDKSELGIYNATRVLYGGRVNGNQALPQKTAEETGAVPIPLDVVMDAAKLSDKIGRMRIVAHNPAETLVIPPVNANGTWRRELNGHTSTNGFHIPFVARHFAGAVVAAIDDTYFLFDCDREELKNHGFNPFFTLLSGPANSVEEAYALLKPKAVAKWDGTRGNSKAVRQGEFFLTPVSPDVLFDRVISGVDKSDKAAYKKLNEDLEAAKKAGKQIVSAYKNAQTNVGADLVQLARDFAREMDANQTLQETLKERVKPTAPKSRKELLAEFNEVSTIAVAGAAIQRTVYLMRQRISLAMARGVCDKYCEGKIPTSEYKPSNVPSSELDKTWLRLRAQLPDPKLYAAYSKPYFNINLDEIRLISDVPNFDNEWSDRSTVYGITQERNATIGRYKRYREINRHLYAAELDLSDWTRSTARTADLIAEFGGRTTDPNVGLSDKAEKIPDHAWLYWAAVGHLRVSLSTQRVESASRWGTASVQLRDDIPVGNGAISRKLHIHAALGIGHSDRSVVGSNVHEPTLTAFVAGNPEERYMLGLLRHSGREHAPAFVAGWHRIHSNESLGNFTVSGDVD